MPRAHLDPITGVADVVALAGLIAARPLRPETITLFLDVQRRGRAAAVVVGPPRPDAVVEIAARMASAARTVDDVTALVIVSVRPGGELVPGDVERWDEARLAVVDAGLELLDWVVIGRTGPLLPRTLVDDADPWPESWVAT